MKIISISKEASQPNISRTPIILIFSLALLISIILINPAEILPGVSYDQYKTSSKDLWERKAAYLWINVKIIIGELTTAVNDTAKNPPSLALEKAVGTGKNPSSLLYQHNELKQNAAIHFLPPPDLSKIKQLCIKMNGITTGQEIIKVKKELKDLEDNLKQLEDISKHARKFVNDFNWNHAIEGLKQIASKTKDIATLSTPVTAVYTVTSWMAQMADRPSSTMKIPKTQFVQENETAIKKRLDRYFNIDAYHRTLGTRMLNILDKLKKGINVNSLSRRDIQEYEMFVRKYNEIIGEVAELNTNNVKYKIIQKEAEKTFVEQQTKKMVQYLAEYKAICARFLVLTDWTQVKPAPILSLAKGVATGTVTAPGNTIRYTYTVENTGNVLIENIDISDNKCQPVTLVSGNSDLDPGHFSTYECSSIPTETGSITNIAFATGRDKFGTPVKSTMSTVTVTVTSKKVTVPDIRGYKVGAAEADLLKAKLELDKKFNYRKSDAPVGEIVDQNPAPGTKAAEGSAVKVWISEEEPIGIFVDPPRTTLTLGEQVSFTTHLIKEDGFVKQLSPHEVKWSPGPGHIFEGTETGEFTITASSHGISGHATVTVEEEERTQWDKPISHANQLTQKALPPPPNAFTWYALCHKSSGDIVYGETTDPTKYDVLSGPFQGPRDTKMWIDQNFPSWRCPSLAGKKGEWNVLCNKQSHSIGIGKSTDPTQFWILAGGFVGEPEARTWTNTNCPSWMCTDGGGCAEGPQSGGDWAVVCSKEHGGIGLTRYPDQGKHWIFADDLRGEKDARMWVNMRCPSWRCNRDGQCIPGVRVDRDKPLELPPDFERLKEQPSLLNQDKIRTDSSYKTDQETGSDPESLPSKTKTTPTKVESTPRENFSATCIFKSKTKANLEIGRRLINASSQQELEAMIRQHCTTDQFHVSVQYKETAKKVYTATCIFLSKTKANLEIGRRLINASSQQELEAMIRQHCTTDQFHVKIQRD